MDKRTMLLVAAIITVAMVLVVAAVWFVRRGRPPAAREPGPAAASSRSRRRSSRTHRAILAAASVAPGAIALGWILTAAGTNLAIGILFGWIAGGILAVVMAGLAYTAVKLGRQENRTALALSVGIGFNVLYLIALLIFVSNAE